MTDTDPVDGTLATYELVCEAYASRARPPGPSVMRYLDAVAALVGGGNVLELGSGPGADADYLEAAGVHVSRTDAVLGFVQRLSRLGHEARRLDVRSDDLGGPWDAIMANAVLLHLPRREFASAVSRIGTALAPGGFLAVTLKEGTGTEWTTAKVGHPRYFTYWQAGPLRAALSAAGRRIAWLEHGAGSGAERWLYVIARPA